MPDLNLCCVRHQPHMLGRADGMGDITSLRTSVKLLLYTSCLPILSGPAYYERHDQRPRQLICFLHFLLGNVFCEISFEYLYFSFPIFLFFSHVGVVPPTFFFPPSSPIPLFVSALGCSSSVCRQAQPSTFYGLTSCGFGWLARRFFLFEKIQYLSLGLVVAIEEHWSENRDSYGGTGDPIG